MKLFVTFMTGFYCSELLQSVINYQLTHDLYEIVYKVVMVLAFLLIALLVKINGKD